MLIKALAYFMAFLIVSFSGLFKVNTDQYLDVVDITQYQTFRSFGTSICWWAQTIEDEKLRDDIAKALFSDTEGLGLDVIRYNVGGGEADNPIRESGTEQEERKAFMYMTAKRVNMSMISPVTKMQGFSLIRQ